MLDSLKSFWCESLAITLQKRIFLKTRIFKLLMTQNMSNVGIWEGRSRVGFLIACESPGFPTNKNENKTPSVYRNRRFFPPPNSSRRFLHLIFFNPILPDAFVMILIELISLFIVCLIQKFQALCLLKLSKTFVSNYREGQVRGTNYARFILKFIFPLNYFLI